MQTKQLSKRKLFGNYRFLQQKENLIDFASNDYLGLARSLEFKEAVLKESASFSHLGSTGSRLLTGNNAYIEQLEAMISSFHGCESGLIFNCGYMANLGLSSAIAQEEDFFLFDTHLHASFRDGIAASSASAFPFRHNDVSHLEARLCNLTCSGEIYICIESVYSSDGSLAPLQEIFQLAEAYGARLIVDEAHAVGVLGPQGKGVVSQKCLEGKLFAHVITFGKALAAFGAIVMGSNDLKERLINFAKPFIYTTALPSFCLAAIKMSYHFFPQMDSERKQIQKLISLINLSQTAIQSFPVEDNATAHLLTRDLADKGFDIRSFLSPTVRRGRESIRLTLHAFNLEEELLELLTHMKNNE